jgi:hypothetical protein
MSGEFRWVQGGAYFYWVLECLDEDGGHPVSKALAALYRAVAPVEKDCAWVEASDSARSRAAIGLVDAWPEIDRAFRQLRELRDEYKGIADAALERT